MGSTNIEWSTDTWNPVVGCTRVSRGCDLCYAAREAAGRLRHTRQYEGLATITPSGRPAFNGTVRLLPERLDQPLRWQRPRMVFVNSMSDLFHEDVPDDFIDKVFAVAALRDGRQHTKPRHVFQVLTKRPERMLKWFDDPDTRCRVASEVCKLCVGFYPSKGSYDWGPEQSWPLSNVWLGVSCEGQETLHERVPLLLQTPAAVRWISAEPLLGPIDFDSTHESDPISSDYLTGIEGERIYDGEKTVLDWVVAGGESGPGCRPMDADWARGIRDQCLFAGVPFFFKQWGGHPDKRGGEKAVLDGQRWVQYPDPVRA